MNKIFIEAESFKNKGGWVVETQSFEVIHSAYLMAHGIGEPVADAVTDFEVQNGGKYTVWALTRDWTAVWNVSDSAGKFNIKINGTILPETLGTNGKDWAWQKAGEIELTKGDNTISLCDLTGFNGRVDAIYLTDGDDVPSNVVADIDEMRRELSYKEIRDYETEFDFIVAGGGIAGICTALTAVRGGLRVALIHDREMLGGCNSSEVRVCQGGMIHFGKYPNLGNIVKETAPVMGDPGKYRAEYFEDYRKLFAFENWEKVAPKYKIFLNSAVSKVEGENGKITSLVFTDTITGAKTRVKAPLFADCTGDGVLARSMGCETMYGREEASRFNESLAPDEAQKLVMGHSIRWCTKGEENYVDFPDIDWGLKFDDDSCLNCFSGDWEQETGFTKDMVFDMEYIRDYGLRAIYSNWAYQKHHYKNKERFANSRIVWVSPIGGKREGYRVVGDYIMTQNDIEDKVMHKDGTACLSWSIDMHFPEPTNLKQFGGEAFRSFAYHRGICEPYPVPYRCLYARDCENLFIGGRLVSTSHVAFSATRVMRTLGQLGEVAGMAAIICKNHSCTPREVYSEYLDELIGAMEQGVETPDAFACSIGHEECYHFRDIGWWYVDRCKAQHPEAIEKYERGVKFLGLKHKYPTPEKWEKV
ncbi:MAG: FAD-dependent oxidoreductase [Clostridia bacterium]|nr:FAD-dependent oxidoreductase [Clostridia bacterium]